MQNYAKIMQNYAKIMQKLCKKYAKIMQNYAKIMQILKNNLFVYNKLIIITKMVKYFCDRCGYSTKRRSAFKQHLKRKNPCPPDISDCSVTTILDKYNFKELYNNIIIGNRIKNEKKGHPKVIRKSSETDDHKGHPKVIRKSSESHPASIKSKKFKCVFCNKEFASKQSRWRHENKRCKLKNAKNSQLIEFENKKLSNEIKKLEQKIININQNTYIENQQNIIINNYGNENTKYITQNLVKKLIKQGPYSSIPKLLKFTHFNDEHPENHNLAIMDVKSKYAHVKKNDIWQIKLLSEILEDLIVNKFNIIDEYYKEGLKSDLPNYKVNIYENYREEIKKNPEIREDIKEKLYQTMVNFSKILGIETKNI